MYYRNWICMNCGWTGLNVESKLQSDFWEKTQFHFFSTPTPWKWSRVGEIFNQNWNLNTFMSSENYHKRCNLNKKNYEQDSRSLISFDLFIGFGSFFWNLKLHSAHFAATQKPQISTLGIDSTFNSAQPHLIWFWIASGRCLTVALLLPLIACVSRKLFSDTIIKD